MINTKFICSQLKLYFKKMNTIFGTGTSLEYVFFGEYHTLYTK